MLASRTYQMGGRYRSLLESSGAGFRPIHEIGMTDDLSPIFPALACTCFTACSNDGVEDFSGVGGLII